MAWVVIDRDRNEKRFANKPILRVRNEGTCDEVCTWVDPSDVNVYGVIMPPGWIYERTGKNMKWGDEPIEIKRNGQQ